ncbi:hypothetical protein B0H16DRAFT_1892799 [Mycena metata]|uniref:Alpha-type protein kinase domain-containing protein n=1 Tax=Mycena metata TaxID=1033252 RepID=A0AAD7I3V0_9AGAR|nr:hypothetical protein B0H16DRAFT_1892799 [Mycena metata]
MASAVGCGDCGLVFKYLDAARSNCFKCEKRGNCADAIQLAEVEKWAQCLGCSVAYKYFPADRTNCGACDAKNNNNKASTKSAPSVPAPGKENEFITVDSDSDEVDVVNPIAALKVKVEQNKKVASGIRLTPKTPSDLPGKTREFLDLRETARKRSGDPSKAASILFKVSIALQKDKGQRLGTRVPPQSRSFSLEDNMQHVFTKLVEMVNEPDGPWAQNYPDKSFNRDDVQFTFKDHVGIPLKYMGAKISVSKFWTAHTQLHGQYFKKASIAASTAEIEMLIPIELTHDKISDSESDDSFDMSSKGSGRKRSKKPKPAVKKRVRVKLEEVVIKGEPMESPMPTRDSRRPVLLRLTCPVIFTKERRITPFSQPVTGEEIRGTTDIAPRTSPEMHRHMQLTHDGAHYLARRLEDDSFQFAPNEELNAARAELDLGYHLDNLLKDLATKYTDVAEVQGYSTPDLFIATIKEQSTVIGHLVCQPKPIIPFNEIIVMKSSVSEAMAHYSYVDGKGRWMLQDFRSAPGLDGNISLFAPVAHSEAGNSGMYDCGPQGLETFQHLHICDELCVKLGLEPFTVA